MKNITLNNGVEMPMLGIGTFNLSPDQAERSVTAALKAGCRLIDTANAYVNERAVGRAIRKSGVAREELFVTTKLWVSEYSRAEKAIDETLGRLGLDYVDLLLLHQPYGDYLHAYKALEDALKSGKVRAIGLSNFYEEKFSQVMKVARIAPAVLQNEMHPYHQEKDMKSYLRQFGTVQEAWFPLGGRDNVRTLLRDRTIAEIAEATGKTPAQVVLRWENQSDIVVIPGSADERHIEENLDILYFELSKDEMSRIDALESRRFYQFSDRQAEAMFTSWRPDFEGQK
ncbi:MAG: aldo/keto reductase [Oscillospiraceae bacterium]|nr:aldo/keto reductase [Oscillospiraceae bacterium]